ncbi:MAG: prenyltransferase/squalene oxidase repeat-containing protein, partial [Dysosmobacter sp.]
GRYAYIPGALRTVAAMGLDVTDLAGHDLLEPLRRPEMVEADEDRLDMLLDLDAAGDAGKTDEFNALRETLITEALARQQSSGEFRYTSKWPAELKRKGVAAEPDRFDYILLTAKSAQALAPYRSRAEVGTAIEKAIDYLSAQQLASGGFLRYGEDVEEDAVVLEMMQALGISPDDERFVKNGNTVPDGMMGWYQGKYSSSAPAPGQGFYRENANWGYNTYSYYEPLGWVKSSWGSMYDPDDPDNPDKCVIERKYINEAAFSGFSLFRTAAQTWNTSTADLVVPSHSDTDVKPDYKQLLKQKTDGMVERVIANYEYLLTEAREITAGEIAGYSSQILALQNANAELTKAEKEKLQEIMTVMVGASGDYYLGRTSSTYSAGAVRAMQYLGMDPANVNGLDYLAVLANTGKLEATSTYDFNSYLRDIESVSAQVWRSRGIDVGTLVDSYAVRILADQTPDGGFDNSYGVNIAQGHTNTSWRDDTIYTAKTITVLAPYRDKEYIAKAIDRAVDYLSSVQLSDGSFPGMTGDSDGGATLTVLKMMEALDISLDDPRFVKNGNTVADAMKTFYIDGVGFLSSFEVEAPLDDLSRLPVYENPVMGNYSTISALTYLQATENGTFGPDGKGSSVFEVVGAALTETPLGAILLAVIVAGILAFAMVRRYRRIKKEQ